MPPDEIRDHSVSGNVERPRLLPRPARCDGAAGGYRLAPGDGPFGVRRGGAARWVFVRRLPALRSNRAVLAGDGIGDGLRGGGQAGDRNLQWVPGALRERPVARGPDPQPEPAVSLRVGALAPRRRRDTVA